MPLFIVRSDITKMQVDAIVNAANNTLLGGGGVDGAIHRAAGRGLLEECRTLGGCETGEAKATAGYELPAKYVIHTVGPVWRGGGHGERELLESCYKNSLAIADRLGCQSIAFPLISAGVYGYPKAEAFHIAHDAILEHLKDSDITAYIALFDSESVKAAAPESDGIAQYIDDHYVYSHSDSAQVANARKKEAEMLASREEPAKGLWIPAFLRGKKKDGRPFITPQKPEASGQAPGSAVSAEQTCPQEQSPDREERQTLFSQTVPPFDEFMAEADAYRDEEPTYAANHPPKPKQSAAFNSVSPQMCEGELPRFTLDESFSQMLLRKIDEKGIKDSDCYKRANVDRKLFSKIRSNVRYRPSKATALAFAVALQLPIEETRELLMKAGFALSNSSEFDLIVRYYIENGNYDIFEINRALFAYDQPLLGNVG